MTRDEWSNRPGRSSKWIQPVVRLAIYIRDKFTCQYCGRDLRNALPHEMGLDHLQCQHHNKTGVLRNGKSLHDPSNLITVCRACNSTRKLTPWRKFATGGAIERIEKAIRRKLNIEQAKALRESGQKWSDQ